MRWEKEKDGVSYDIGWTAIKGRRVLRLFSRVTRHEGEVPYRILGSQLSGLGMCERTDSTGLMKGVEAAEVSGRLEDGNKPQQQVVCYRIVCAWWAESQLAAGLEGITETIQQHVDMLICIRTSSAV